MSDDLDRMREAMAPAVTRLRDGGEALACLVGDSDTLCALVRTTALRLGMDEESARRLSLASQYHDVGKLDLPASILNAPRKLTDGEMSIIRTHPNAGLRIVTDLVLGAARRPSVEASATMAVVAAAHHEKFDGSGYPRGLAGYDVPLEAQIVSCADIFEALLSSRPYKSAWSPNMALRHIVDMRGIAFSPEVTDAFAEAVALLGFDGDEPLCGRSVVR